MELLVVRETDDWIAVDKPSGLLTIAGRGGPEPGSQSTLQALVARRLGAKAWVVHRLDRGASGLVLFAKHAAAHRALCKLFESRSIHKEYRVAVQGRLEGEGLIEKPLREFGSGRMGVAAVGHREAKPSVTRWRALKTGERASLLAVFPETGRRHQIRVHLYSLGHPVLGDELYGDEASRSAAPRLMLHCAALRFTGPSENMIELAAEIPGEFSQFGTPKKSFSYEI